MIDGLLQAFMALPQVEAIALGGSRAGERYDETSDYDVYIYCTAPVTEAERRPILERYCRYAELSNHFWELEDNCTLKSGVDLDILYRHLEDFTREVASVVEGCQPHNGYTTCMWHNLNTCRILYDPAGRLAAAKERFAVPYPEGLRTAILRNSMALLYDRMPAYYHQIKKAALRGDLVSVGHRTAAFMEVYFDAIFALNRKTHPGEKRLVSLCREQCPHLPEGFEERITALYAVLFTDPPAALQILEEMAAALRALMEKTA